MSRSPLRHNSALVFSLLSSIKTLFLPVIQPHTPSSTLPFYGTIPFYGIGAEFRTVWTMVPIKLRGLVIWKSNFVIFFLGGGHFVCIIIHRYSGYTCKRASLHSRKWERKGVRAWAKSQSQTPRLYRTGTYMWILSQCVCPNASSENIKQIPFSVVQFAYKISFPLPDLFQNFYN